MRIWIIVMALLLAAGAGWAQTDDATKGAMESYKNAEKAYQDAAMDLQRLNLRTQKRGIIDAVMPFNDAQSKAFWPVFDKYEAQLIQLNDMRLAVIKEYAANYLKLTDEKAIELTGRMLEFQEKRIALRKSYMASLNGVLPGVQIARLLQIENQLDLVIDLQIATEVPDVE